MRGWKLSIETIICRPGEVAQQFAAEEHGYPYIGPKFSSQCSQQAVRSCPLWGSDTLFWPLLALHFCAQVRTHN